MPERMFIVPPGACLFWLVLSSDCDCNGFDFNNGDQSSASMAAGCKYSQLCLHCNVKYRPGNSTCLSLNSQKDYPAPPPHQSPRTSSILAAYANQGVWGLVIRDATVSWLVGWYFEPSQPQRITSGAKKTSVCLLFTLYTNYQTTNFLKPTKSVLTQINM